MLKMGKREIMQKLAVTVPIIFSSRVVHWSDGHVRYIFGVDKWICYLLFSVDSHQRFLGSFFNSREAVCFKIR